nr:hypothetical protein [Chitinophagaceae bacterium]
QIHGTKVNYGAHAIEKKVEIKLTSTNSDKDVNADAFIAQLKVDGLIKESATVEYTNGKLFINDVEQTAEVIAKYSSFLDGQTTIKLKIDSK